MNTYYIYLNQNGEGCDYTIGCGNKLILMASNKDSIISNVENYIKENYPVGSEYELKNVLIFENPIDFDIISLYNKQREEISNEILKNQEKIEYENFLRLKRKFDN